MASNLNKLPAPPVKTAITDKNGVLVSKEWAQWLNMLQSKIGSNAGSGGATGVQGPVGPVGPQGPSGAQGPEGPAGAPILDETTFPPTPTGDPVLLWNPDDNALYMGVKENNNWVQISSGAMQGATGMGIQGVTGGTGSTGDTGVQGQTGVAGATGVQGVIGSTGVQGVAGATGVQGINGATGVTGGSGSANISGTTNHLIKFSSATAGNDSFLVQSASNSMSSAGDMTFANGFGFRGIDPYSNALNMMSIGPDNLMHLGDSNNIVTGGHLELGANMTLGAYYNSGGSFGAVVQRANDSGGAITLGASTSPLQLSSSNGVGIGSHSVNLSFSGNDFVLRDDVAGGNIILQTNGSTEQARVDSNGNLLIGTTTATHGGVSFGEVLTRSTAGVATPRTGAVLSGTGQFYDAEVLALSENSGNSLLSHAQLQTYGTSALGYNYSTVKRAQASFVNLYSASNADCAIGTNSASDLVIGTGNDERLRIDSTGLITTGQWTASNGIVEIGPRDYGSTYTDVSEYITRMSGGFPVGSNYPNPGQGWFLVCRTAGASAGQLINQFVVDGTGNTTIGNLTIPAFLNVVGTSTSVTTNAGTFGCNGATPQSSYSVNGASDVDLGHVVALCNQLRTALINNGICV